MSESHHEHRHVGPLSFAQITAGLVWPTLLRAFPLALAPARLVIAVLVVAAAGLIGKFFDAISGDVEGQRGAFEATSGVLAALFGRPAPFDMGFHDAPFWINMPSAAGWMETLFSAHPFTMIALMVVLAPIVLIGGTALCRMTALDVAGDFYMSSREGLGYAFARIPGLLAAALIPAVLTGLLALLLALAGLLLLSLPGVSVLGGLVYGLLIILGALLVLVVVGFALAFPLIIPGLAIEGTDAFDALQRAYSYVFGRTGRLLLYIAIIIAQGILAIFVVTWIINQSISATRHFAFAWLSDAAQSRLETLANDSTTLSAQLISFWESVAQLISAGFIVSFFFAGSTLLYLVARRVNDEQDIRDIWMPGAVGGTIPATIEPIPASDASDSAAQSAADDARD